MIEDVATYWLKHGLAGPAEKRIPYGATPKRWSGKPLHRIPIGKALSILSKLEQLQTSSDDFMAVAVGESQEECLNNLAAGIVQPMRISYSYEVKGKFRFVTGNHPSAGPTELLMSDSEVFYHMELAICLGGPRASA